jgi:hypothetical protein
MQPHAQAPLARSCSRALPPLLALVLAGCATTHIVESWTAPGLTPADLQFDHVVAIAVMPEVARQRIVEDALAAAAEQTRVTPAHAILTPGDRAEVDRLRQVLERNGIDGAVAVSLVGVDEKQTYVPGTPRPYARRGFYGYYGAMGGVAYDPGYVRTDTYLVVETSLYDVAAGKLLWTGVSRTLNPSETDALIEGIVKAAREELRSQGLLP